MVKKIQELEKMSLLFTFYSGQNKNELFILLLLLSSQRASVTDLFRCKLSFCYSHLSICKKTIYFETPCIVSYLFAQVKVKGLCKYQRSGQISLLPASSSLVNKKWEQQFCLQQKDPAKMFTML